MKKLFAGAVSIAVLLSLSPALSHAQSKCPAEVAQAKEMLSKSKKVASVKPEDIQAPRTMAGARQEVAAPRENQNVQSPRGNQDVQSPRGNQNVQSPRGNQDVQSPRVRTCSHRGRTRTCSRHEATRTCRLRARPPARPRRLRLPRQISPRPALS